MIDSWLVQRFFHLFINFKSCVIVNFEKSNERDLFFFSTRNSAERVSKTVQGGLWHASTWRKDVFLGKFVIGRSNISPSSMGSSSTASHPKTGKQHFTFIKVGLFGSWFTKSKSLFLFRIASSLGLDVPEH